MVECLVAIGVGVICEVAEFFLVTVATVRRGTAEDTRGIVVEECVASGLRVVCEVVEVFLLGDMAACAGFFNWSEVFLDGDTEDGLDDGL